MQAGPPASSACQAALGPALAPEATPCAQPKHQSSPFPRGGRGSSSCQRFLSTAPAAFPGLARALPGPSGPPAPPCQPNIPTPGCGNAAPGVGHPELAGGPQDTPALCHHTGDAAHAKEPLDQAPPAAPSLSLGWLMARGVQRDAEPQDLGAFSPTLGRGGRVTPALVPGWGDPPVWGRKAGPPPWVPFKMQHLHPLHQPHPSMDRAGGLARDLPQGQL